MSVYKNLSIQIIVIPGNLPAIIAVAVILVLNQELM